MVLEKSLCPWGANSVSRQSGGKNIWNVRPPEHSLIADDPQAGTGFTSSVEIRAV